MPWLFNSFTPVKGQVDNFAKIFKNYFIEMMTAKPKHSKSNNKGDKQDKNDQEKKAEEKLRKFLETCETALPVILQFLMVSVSTPSYFPINVANPTTTAECELGIPPAPIILLKLNFLVVIKSYINLNNCIPNHNKNGIYMYLFWIKAIKLFILFSLPFLSYK